MRWCFLQLGKTYATTKQKLSILKDMVERSSLSFCCREFICDSEIRASRSCRSKPPDKNQSITCKSWRLDLRLSTKKIYKQRTKKLNKCSATAGVWSATARSTSQQVTKVRTHAHLAWPTTWHKRMPHDSRFYLLGIQ